MDTGSLFEYEIQNNEIRIVRYTGGEGITGLSIPEIIDGYPVSVIGKGAFSENGAYLLSIILPDSVRRIEDEAFEFCLSLSELVLNEGLLSIGSDICLVTSVLELYIPSTVEEIADPFVLGHMSLKIAPNNPWFHFDGYGLYRSIKGVKSLVSLDFNDERTFYEIEDGTLRIEDDACRGQEYIEQIVCPDSLTYIGEASFADCKSLKKIGLNDGIVEIGRQAFWNCASLEEFTLPYKLKDLGEDALGGLHSHNINLNIDPKNNYFYIQDGGLYKKEGEKIKLIKSQSCEGKVVILDGITHIGYKAFEGMNITEIVFPESILSVDKNAFCGCSRIKSLYFEGRNIKIYVPQTPLYRKKEIMELIYDEKRDENLYSHKYDGLIFDLKSYDALWETYRFVSDRVGMIICRLNNPAELDDDRKCIYLSWLDENFKEMLDDIYEREDLERLNELYDIGYLNNTRLRHALKILSPRNVASINGYLMELISQDESPEKNEFEL